LGPKKESVNLPITYVAVFILVAVQLPVEATGDVQIVTDFPAQNEVTALGIREFASIAR
jgi:hypothetical protein